MHSSGSSGLRGNSFAPLSQLMDQDDSIVNEEVAQVNPKPPRIPPITIIEKTNQEIKTMLVKLLITDHFVKLTSIGTKVFCPNEKSYKKLYDHLVEAHIKFFTHDINSKKVFKIVLTGLHTVPISELTEELKANGITCSEIKSMTVRSKRYDDQSTYLLYMEKGTITLSEIRQKCRQLFRTIVHFDFYRKSKGPVRCFKCQTYGHGANGCHLSTKCSLCAGDHLTSACPTRNNEEAVRKCANCQGNHPASSPLCPARRHYLELQHELSKKHNQRRSRGTMPTPPITNQRNFPKLPSNHRESSPAGPSHIFHSGGTAYSNVLRNNASNDLFTYSEVMTITNELLTKLKSCKNKEDQFRVITEVTFKYLYNNGQ